MTLGSILKWKDNNQEVEVTLGLMADKNFWNHIKNGDIIPIELTEARLMKRKLALKYWIIVTLIVWASYFGIWLIVSFIDWNLKNPFEWINNMPAMKGEQRASILAAWATLTAIKWIVIIEKIKSIIKNEKVKKEIEPL